MLKVTGVIGVPGSGKSTLIRKSLPLGEGVVVKFKYPHEDEEKKWQPITLTLFPQEKKAVFGTYSEGEAFPGTDRLSKSCAPSVRCFLRDIARGKARNLDGTEVDSSWEFIWEGERFTNSPFFDFLSHMQKCGLMVVHITYLNPTEVDLERNRQGRSQDLKWLRGMETRVSNVFHKYKESLGIHESRLS